MLYLKQNQTALHAENYNVLRDHIGPDDAAFERHQVGKAMILPATFVGSPRYMNARYQDAMAIVHAHGKCLMTNKHHYDNYAK